MSSRIEKGIEAVISVAFRAKKAKRAEGRA
jgi:hypothetical protein